MPYEHDAVPREREAVPRGRERVCRVRADRDGPLLIEGPVEIIGPDGRRAVSRRFLVAVCTCRRSRTYPWCDTSHRRRGRLADDPGPAGDDPGSAGGETQE
ncbi:CDGSH iron-sulfur domain-containing protein [Streptomyces sp. NPDC001222]|uniref:CDGSH iron-sulfur domain-containing protein n=1 Tax=Streptomyces sp. NPDC001222 TaxID=3364548 RepID=UPI00367DF4B4